MLYLDDRIRETTTTTGTGAYTLLGSVADHQPFNGHIPDGWVIPCAVFDGAGSWETGDYTFTAPSSLARTTVRRSSNSNNAVNWGAGTKNVIVNLSAFFAQNPDLFTLKVNALATPAAPTGTPTGTGGTIAAGNNYCKVAAVDAQGNVTVAGAESSAVVTSGSTSIIQWTCAVVPGAVSYRWYCGTATGAEANYFTSTTNTFTQTAPASTGTAGAPTVMGNTGGAIVAGPIVQQFSGLIYVQTTAGGSPIRGYADIISGNAIAAAPTGLAGAIEKCEVYNAYIDQATGAWVRDVANVECWAVKYTDTGATEERWYAPAATGVPVWQKVYSLDMSTGNLTMGGAKLIQAKHNKECSDRAAIAIASGVLPLDYQYGFIDVTLNAAITSITSANVLAASAIGQNTIVTFIADGTARAITWPTGNGTSTDLFVWDGGNSSGSGAPAAVPSVATSGHAMQISICPVSAHLFRCAVIANNYPL